MNNYDRFDDDHGRAGVVNTCNECDRVLDSDNECWYCHYQVLEQQRDHKEERLERKIRSLEIERDELNNKIYNLESDKRKLESKVRELSQSRW